MPLGHYIANVRDIEFNLFEVLKLGRGSRLGRLRRSRHRHRAHHARRGRAGWRKVPSPNRSPTPTATRRCSTRRRHTISVPAELAKSVQAVKEAEWWRIGLAEEVGGVAAPAALTWAINEMLLCANSVGGLLVGAGPCDGPFPCRGRHRTADALGGKGPGARLGGDDGADRARRRLRRRAGRAKAIAQPDGTWHIEGVKRFISGGDVGDTAENIFHLVLARPEGAGPGTKGLSLFYVPQYLFDPETLELGPRNGVFATGLEHKMGLKSSPTCELTFGAHGVPAVGYLVGDVHNGIAQMFTVIEHARMTIGVKAAGTLSTGYLNALDYAKTRVRAPT